MVHGRQDASSTYSHAWTAAVHAASRGGPPNVVTTLLDMYKILEDSGDSVLSYW